MESLSILAQAHEGLPPSMLSWVQTGAITVCTTLLVWLVTKHLPSRDKAALEERNSLLSAAERDRREFRDALDRTCERFAVQIKSDNDAWRKVVERSTDELHVLGQRLEELVITHGAGGKRNG